MLRRKNRYTEAYAKRALEPASRGPLPEQPLLARAPELDAIGSFRGWSINDWVTITDYVTDVPSTELQNARFEDDRCACCGSPDVSAHDPRCRLGSSANTPSDASPL